MAAAALGRTMTGALLFAANLKNKEAVTITFDGHGPLGKVTADAVPEGFVRGAVGNPHVNLPLNAKGKLDVGGGVGADGMVTVTRFTGLRNPVTGSTALTDGEIADDLTKYLYDSEQTPSSVGLGVLVDPDFRCIGAGGFLLQPLPGLDQMNGEIIAAALPVHMAVAWVATRLGGGKGVAPEATRSHTAAAKRAR